MGQRSCNWLSGVRVSEISVEAGVYKAGVSRLAPQNSTVCFYRFGFNKHRTR